MTLQILLDAWITSGAFHDVNPPAPEAEIKTAEEKIGTPLPQLLCEVYQLFNGGWWWDLEFFTALEPKRYFYSLTDGNEQFIEDGWHIPKEIRLFAGMGGEEFFGIWLAETGNPIYNHPIIEVGELHDEGCMGVAGTNLLSFLHRWSAYHLVYDERDKLEEGGEELRRIQSALDMLQVPQSLRGEHFDDEMSPFRKWADPQLPNPYGDSYSQQYTIGDLKRLFGET
ncbi:SMI1/KNR4 family protein [Candidatus Poribacteria bacterium]|nr:SMI1/KNR4 family protein [Candidatus Poribacteria bacterium]